MNFCKKVCINNNVEVILIPSKDEYIDLELWYDDDTLNKIKNEAIMEIRAYSYLKHISFLEARHQIYAVK